MPDILIREVPSDVHSTLQRRAAERGVSLQQYLLSELERLAERPTVDEVLKRIAGRTGGTIGFDEAVSDITAGRHSE